MMNLHESSSLFNFHPLPHWVYDLATFKILDVNDAAIKLYGYSREEFLSLDLLALSPTQNLNDLIATHKGVESQEGNIRFGSFIHHTRKEKQIWVELNGHNVHYLDKKCMLVVAQDVTAAKREEIQDELVNKISNAFSESPDIYKSLSKLTEIIATVGDFTFSEIWLPSKQKNKLRLFASYTTTPEGDKFYNYSDIVLETEIGQGLQGLVWAQNKPLLWGSNDIKKSFLRSEAARTATLKSAMGIPLLHRDKLVGIILVGSTRGDKALEQHQDILTEIGKSIGIEIKRKRLESDLPYMVDTLSDLVCIIDYKGHFLRINKVGMKLLGYAEEEVIGQLINKFTHPLDKSVFDDEISKGATSFRFENRFLTKSKDIIWLSWHCNHIVEEGVIYATAKNVTEEKKLRALVADASHLARIGGWEIDLIAREVYWSKLVHELHGTDPDTYTPTYDEALNFYREDHREKAAQALASSLRSRKPFDFEAPIITAGGAQLWMRVNGTTEFIDDECVRIFGSVQDINSRKETELRLKSITDDLPGVAFQYYRYPDGSDKLASVSEGARKIWQLSPEECEKETTKIWTQIKNGGDYDQYIADIEQSITTLSQWRSKWRNLLPNGEIRWHQGYGTPYRLANGTILFNSMIFDITSEVKLTNLYEETSQLAKIGGWEMEIKQDATSTLYWSPMVKKILEVPADYVPTLTKGIDFSEVANRDLISNSVEQLIQSGREFDEEVLVVTRKGKEKWVRIIGRSERANGVCTKIFGSIQDIHDSKTTKLQLTEILGSISDAFYVLDENWNFTYFNKKAEQLLSRKRDEIIGKEFWEVFPLVVGTELESVYRRVARSNKTESFEYFYRGDQSWYELNVYPSSGGVSSYFRNIDERKKAVEQIQKAFEEKINIIESISDAFFTMDHNFIVTYWNKTAEELLAVKRQLIVGKCVWDVFPDAIESISHQNYRKVLETGVPITFEDYYGIWFEVNVSPSADGISVFFRDITHRKEADERLLKALDEKNQILESIGDAFIAVDEQWQVTYWNKVAEIVLLKRRDEMLGNNLWDKYEDAIESEFYTQYHKAVKTRKTVSFEAYYPALKKWFEVTAYPSKGLSIYFKDITLRKESDIRVLQANERFEKVAQATTDAIWDWDIENNLFYRGSGFAKLFGFTRKITTSNSDPWLGKNHFETLPKIKASLLKTLRDPTQEFWRQQYRIILKSGVEKTVVDKGAIIRDKDGKAIRVVGAISDISERIKYENDLKNLNNELKENVRKLEISNEQLEKFAFIASHDLQEPLRMISSFLNQLERKYSNELDEKATQYIHFATDGAKRMKQIILDLLEYSKAGTHTDSREEINFEGLIEDYQVLRRRLIEEKKATIRLTGNILHVNCFKVPLIQTVHSLLDNALKYSKPDVAPVIEISISESKSNWQVSISDNGIGIDPQFFDKIFIIFQRLFNRDQYEGTGIGLAIAKKNIESWGGKIWIQSEIGEGSTFHFTIEK